VSEIVHVMPLYEELVHDVTHLGESCDINAILALSAVTGFPIHTFWPPRSVSLQPRPLTQFLVGRGVDRQSRSVAIMWSTAGTIGPLGDVEMNHFVPLVQRPNQVPSDAVIDLFESDDLCAPLCGESCDVGASSGHTDDNVIVYNDEHVSKVYVCNDAAVDSAEDEFAATAMVMCG